MGGFMNIKALSTLAFVLVFAFPPKVAADKHKKPLDRGMLEKMEAVPCGAKERGITGLGSVFATAGVEHVNSNEKLCPQYLLRTDEMEYHIRPTDGKHPNVLPVGHEGEFTIKKDRMFLRMPDGDGKTRTYEVVAMNPIGSVGSVETGSAKLPDKH
jgi:hypothetical protein